MSQHATPSTEPTRAAAPAGSDAPGSQPRTRSEGDPLAEELRRRLDGDNAAVREACRTLDPQTFGPPTQPLGMEEHRNRVRQQLTAMLSTPWPAAGFPVDQGGTARYGDAVTAFEMLGHADLSLFVKAGVQWGLFGGAVSLLGTERHHDLVPRIISGDLAGCFAMTETGHGSDVQGLLTTATYDSETDEIVVHSPTPAARKDFIGGAACDARMAAVFAQLHVGDQDHGVHCVLVPIRDEDGGTLPGVTLSDCGPKLGLNGVDNGRILFDQVRVPRTNLLGRFGDIDDEGRYHSPIESSGRRFFTMLGALIRGRISVAGGAGAAAQSALALAVRYGDARTQFARPDSTEEVTLLDYRTHQRRLLPLVADAYAFSFAQDEVVRDLHDVLAGQLPGEADQRRLETRAAGIKAAMTWHATRTIQECREACGGAGYMWANRFASLKADTDIFTTFEGDNTVLLQLVAKSLLGDYQETFGDLDTVGIVRFGARIAAGTVLERSAMRGLVQTIIDAAPRRDDDTARFDRATQLRLVQDREEHLVETLAGRLRRAQDPEADAFAVFNQCQDHVVATAAAHVDRLVLEAFAAAVESCPEGEARTALDQLCDLHALSTIERHKAWYLEHDRLSASRAKAVTAAVNSLCEQLRPRAVSLVDGFGIPESWLTTEMMTDHVEGRW
jgi:acyl-CoA oxidase